MSLTPMLQQYQALRARLPKDTILFFRLGDFYEMFFEDARQAATFLDITLTSRDGGAAGKVPMCGVPYHAAQGYINRLTRNGFKVAICEQVENPKFAKGIVKREIVRIITPATNLEDDSTNTRFNYIASIAPGKKNVGFAYLDLGTGDFSVGEYSCMQELEDELARLQPQECVVPVSFDTNICKGFFSEARPVITEYEAWVFDPQEAQRLICEQYGIVSLASFGIADLRQATAAAGAILYYLRENLFSSLSHLKPPIPIQHNRFMMLDKSTLYNLEIVRPSSNNDAHPTLYTLLNRTLTPMGERLLFHWLTRPLLDPETIRERLNAVAELKDNRQLRSTLCGHLTRIKDLEKIIARINCGTPSARDMVALGSSLAAIPDLKTAITASRSHLLRVQAERLIPLPDITAIIEQAFVPIPPPSIKEGGFIREGFNSELDELRNIATHAKDFIADLQRREIEATGIKSLKIRYNKVFGYYIDVTRPNLSQVPERYIRKQTLVNSERFIIPELREYEEKIRGAEARALELELEIFETIRSHVLSRVADIQQTAAAIAILDVLVSFATVAHEHHYVQPEVNESSTIYIAGGRHPVIETTLNGEPFVDNDVHLDQDEHQLLIITGPNMAGKSTYIRQVALIVLMAQVGSFVPARVAKIGVVDRVFSRIGASDNLAQGHSTFMVEMIETAYIIHNATSKSLLVFDEIGRGTSTFDGVSIAWAVCEYLTEKTLRPKTLFATHYHELTELADHRRGIKNYNVTVKEIQDGILFLRKVVPGGADRSYGIHVGKLAGLPDDIIRRASEILLCLEEERISEESIAAILRKKRGVGSVYDLPLFKPLKGEPVHTEHTAAEHPVLQELRTIDPTRLTPIEAIVKIAEWKKNLNRNDAGNFATGGN
ncbi:MAG: DNA mismatch repair protein MutS [Desulfobacterota bacterium]|nr:DNA mismatch repair protein MutS [Thermodesulfobacteriota bacterium]